jgi:TolB-like protein/AraC-like DNA-binding protein
MSNISEKNFGAQDVASQLGLSSSQTLRKVKAVTGKSVNQYIRELRLEKAVQLIKKTDLTMAEISYQVGFGSHSYFNNTFVKYYGITPGEYKAKNIRLSELAIKAIKKKHRETSIKMKVFYPVVIVLVFVIGYLLINPSSSKKTVFSNSIAVLPFKALNHEDSQWIADGVSDNIIYTLTQMKDLAVISFTSSSTYRNTDKKIPQIADELGVSYILEGSVTSYGNKIKIIVQLIDSNDQHIWSKEYNESFDDVITVQNNVAKEVMKQLKLTLHTSEDILNKYSTKSFKGPTNMRSPKLIILKRDFLVQLAN